ncbi:MAG: hypothetical protein Q4D38_09045 [Planctomycetia bacterium]|nr:hypothetical protein [Planctomycetia bacterium]
MRARFWRVAILAIVCVGCLTKESWGWGEGHDVIGAAVAERLPSPWREKLLENDVLYEQFLHDNHYPDSREKMEQERWGETSLALFASHGIHERFGFHSSEGRCVVFQILVEAIRQNRENEVFLALAILAHSISDQAACNHEPLIQYATYTLGREGLNVVPSLPLDAGWLHKHDFSREIWENRCRKIAISPSYRCSRDVFFQLCFCEWEAVDCFVYGVPILEAASRWVAERDRGAGLVLAEHLSDLAAWGVERTLDVFLAAVEFAKRGDSVVWQREMLTELPSKIDAFIAQRPIERESLILPFLPRDGEAAPIRVVYDSTGRFSEGFFHGGDRIVAAQIAGTLRKKGAAVAILDLREALRDGLLGKGIELLVVPAQRCGSYHGLLRERWEVVLQEFRAAGGKMLWVGAIPPHGVAPELDRSWRMIEEKDQYARPAYPVAMDVLRQSSVVLCGTERSWRYCRTPQGSAGWFWPSGRVFLESLPENVAPIVELRTPEDRFVIGVASDNFAFVPASAFFPYVLTEEKPRWSSAVTLELDSAGESILAELLRQMNMEFDN